MSDAQALANALRSVSTLSVGQFVSLKEEALRRIETELVLLYQLEMEMALRKDFRSVVQAAAARQTTPTIEPWKAEPA